MVLPNKLGEEEALKQFKYALIWNQKYWPISRRMLKVVGKERFESKSSAQEAKSFYLVFGSINENN